MCVLNAKSWGHKNYSCQSVGSQKYFMPKCGVTKNASLGSQKGPAILTCAKFSFVTSCLNFGGKCNFYWSKQFIEFLKGCKKIESRLDLIYTAVRSFSSDEWIEEIVHFRQGRNLT